MGFINKYSWKSFLSSQAKNPIENNGLYHWTIKNKIQLVTDRILNLADIPYLKNLIPFNYFYFSQENIDILKQIPNINLSKKKDPDIFIPIEDLDFKGKKNKNFRWAINNCNKMNLTIQTTLNNYQDMHTFLAEWDDTAGDKYFQVRTGKNRYFFKNNLHLDCITIFIYDQAKLVSFAVLSPPINNNCSYMIGKSLYMSYPGLSEFTDIEIYKLAKSQGATSVNLGGGSSKLKKYKLKFPNAYEDITFDGSVTK